MLQHIYTGVGSRSVSSSEYELMVAFAATMSEVGFTLRSGKAQGSDEAFQIGHQSYILQHPNAPSVAEIYIPWERFNNPLLWDVYDIVGSNQSTWPQAKNLAKEIHPRGKKLSDAALLLHARNMYQVVGSHMITPSDFCVYCSDEDHNGTVSGGTASAVNLSRRLHIPTYNIRTNMGDDNVRQLWAAGSTRDIESVRRIIREWESNTRS